MEESSRAQNAHGQKPLRLWPCLVQAQAQTALTAVLLAPYSAPSAPSELSVPAELSAPVLFSAAASAC